MLNKRIKMKTNQRGFATIVILLAVALVIGGGAYYVVASGEDNQGNTVDETIAQTTQAQIDAAAAASTQLLNGGDYPALYEQYNLPQYPGATIVYDGRSNDNLNDGISLSLTTSDPVQTVGTFFANAFANLSDWTYTPPNVTLDSLYGSTAIHATDDLRYQLVVTKTPDNTIITITLIKQ